MSLERRSGETLGIVGESGCGKSTLGRLMLRLLEPTAGSVASTARTSARPDGASPAPQAAEMQIIFQDPYGSLNPRMRVGDIVGEGLDIHGLARGAEKTRARRRAARAASACAPTPYDRYPHEFSGGQRQRIGIARALAVEPRLDRRRRTGLGARRLDSGADHQPAAGPAGGARARRTSSLRTTCELWNISATASRSCIWARSSSWLTASSSIANPRHPYTRALLSAVPSAGSRRAGASASSCAATSRARSTRRPGARFIRAARLPRRAVAREEPRARRHARSPVACHVSRLKEGEEERAVLEDAREERRRRASVTRPARGSRGGSPQPSF